jgi:hypothetical protein
MLLVTALDDIEMARSKAMALLTVRSQMGLRSKEPCAVAI